VLFDCKHSRLFYLRRLWNGSVRCITLAWSEIGGCINVRAAAKEVGPGASSQLIAAWIAVQDIVAAAAVEDIVAAAAVENIVAVPTVEDVVAIFAIKRIGAISAAEQVITAVSFDLVRSVQAKDHVDTVCSMDGIIPIGTNFYSDDDRDCLRSIAQIEG